MTDLAIELLRELGVSAFTKRHLDITERFLHSTTKIDRGISNQDECEKFLSSLGEWTSSDLQKTQAFIEVNFG